MNLEFRTLRLPSRTIPDAEEALLRLEKRFIELDDPEIVGSSVEEWGRVIDEMVAIEARSIEGIRAKARVACRLRLGDLDQQFTSDFERNRKGNIVDSILRDLIRTLDPTVERKGAVADLLKSLGE